MSPADSAASPARAAGRLFLRRALVLAGGLFVLLALVQLPLVILNRFPGQVLYLPLWEIIKDAGLMLVLYALASAACGVVAAAIAALLQPLGAVHAERWLALCLYAGVAVIAMTLAPIAQAWWQGFRLAIGFALPLGWLKIPLLLLGSGGAILMLWRHGWTGVADGVLRRLANGRTAALGALLIATPLVLLTGHASIRPFGWAARPAPATASGKGTNVILVVIDTLSAADMSLYGFSLETTPGLARLASRSYVFDNFFSSSNFTTPSVTSLLTGRHLLSHRLFHIDGRLRPQDRDKTLAALLHANGYTTGASISNSNAHPLNLHAEDGFDFLSDSLMRAPGSAVFSTLALRNAKVQPILRDVWWTPYVLARLRWSHSHSLQRQSPFPPALVVDSAREFLARTRQPYFLWAHFLPPHAPYLPPQPFLGRFLPSMELRTWGEQKSDPAAGGTYDLQTMQPGVDRLRLRYDEYLAYMDREVSQFVESLEQSGALDNTVLIVTSDHGESFDHGWQGHTGPLLNNGLVHVPLIIHLPGQTRGQRIASYAGHVDLLPTVLDLLELPVPAWADGQSLAPAMQGKDAPERAQLAMNFERSSSFVDPAAGTLAVMQRPYKLVRYLQGGCEELFNLEADAAESANLTVSEPLVADRLRAELARRTHLPLPAPQDRARQCSPLINVVSATR